MPCTFPKIDAQAKVAGRRSAKTLRSRRRAKRTDRCLAKEFTESLLVTKA
jgi:hypothetical protein